MPKYGSGLSPPMSSSRIVTGRLPSGVDQSCRARDTARPRSAELAGQSRAARSATARRRRRRCRVRVRHRRRCRYSLPRELTGHRACRAGSRQAALQRTSVARQFLKPLLKFASRRLVAARSRACRESHRPAVPSPLAICERSPGISVIVGIPFSRANSAACEPCPSDSTTTAATLALGSETTSDGSSRSTTSTLSRGNGFEAGVLVRRGVAG